MFKLGSFGQYEKARARILSLCNIYILCLIEARC